MPKPLNFRDDFWPRKKSELRERIFMDFGRVLGGPTLRIYCTYFKNQRFLDKIIMYLGKALESAQRATKAKGRRVFRATKIQIKQKNWGTPAAREAAWVGVRSTLPPQQRWCSSGQNEKSLGDEGSWKISQNSRSHNPFALAKRIPISTVQCDMPRQNIHQ